MIDATHADATHADDPIRAKIEALGTSLSLPTVRRALGVLEGEHASARRGGGDDVMDIRAYEAGDEARLIDWKTSARCGRPMVVLRERRVTSRVWLLMDVGRPMTGACANGEQAWQVAANALRMVAALSLRRSDDISLVLADAASITRMPFHGGFAQFGHTLDQAMDRGWEHDRNIDALLAYARRIRDRRALIVLATDEHALSERHVAAIGRIARTHPVVLIDVATINPFDAAHPSVADGRTGRRVPAFLRVGAAAEQVDTHRAFVAAALERELSRYGSRMIRAASSEAMFAAFIRLVASTAPLATGGRPPAGRTANGGAR